MDRIIFLDGHPNPQVFDPLRISETAKETLECDLAAEHEARSLCIEGRDHCERVRDCSSKQLFEELIADEQSHIDHLETPLDLIGRIGEANWGQLNAVLTDEAKGDD